MQPNVEFQIRTPVDDEGLRANVISALARDLPELGWAPLRDDRLKVVAGGPSARHASLDGPTLALNGALGLFGRKGPNWWAGCDPQAHLADFLKDPPQDTVYLVASKCHPAVFDALAKRKVVLWHVWEPMTADLFEDRDSVLAGTSVTICAFELMGMLGFRHFETWGWDGCYVGGAHHALPQAHAAVDIENTVGGQVFSTTTTWALEAQDAWNKLKDLDIDIRGGGMIGAIFDYLRAP